MYRPKSMNVLHRQIVSGSESLIAASCVVFLCAVFMPGRAGAGETYGNQEPDTMPWITISAHWNNGSLPPPHRRSGSLVLHNNGNHERTELRGYAKDGGSTTTTRGRISFPELVALTNALDAAGIHEIPWQEAKEHPVGGSMRWLSVTTEGGNIDIPAFPIDSQKAKADEMFDLVMQATKPLDTKDEASP